MRTLLTLCLLLTCILGASNVRAEPVPDFALEKDYQNCMGEDTPQTNPEHANYCNCVMNKIKTWDLDTYGEVATEQSKDPTNTAKISPKLGDIAKECMAQALK